MCCLKNVLAMGLRAFAMRDYVPYEIPSGPPIPMAGKVAPKKPGRLAVRLGRLLTFTVLVAGFVSLMRIWGTRLSLIRSLGDLFHASLAFLFFWVLPFLGCGTPFAFGDHPRSIRDADALSLLFAPRCLRRPLFLCYGLLPTSDSFYF